MENLEEKLSQIELKIKQAEKERSELIYRAIVGECTSHIYKIDLWGVSRCIFCNRTM